MKILLATPIYPPDIGGPAIYVQRLARELSQRNIEVTVITFSDEERIEDTDFSIISFRIIKSGPKSKCNLCSKPGKRRPPQPNCF